MSVEMNGRRASTNKLWKSDPKEFTTKMSSPPAGSSKKKNRKVKG